MVDGAVSGGADKWSGKGRLLAVLLAMAMFVLVVVPNSPTTWLPRPYCCLITKGFETPPTPREPLL